MDILNLEKCKIEIVNMETSGIVTFSQQKSHL